MENDRKGAVRVEANKTPRLTFSVSREFESILPEIESMPNMSRFVCEAIYEKLQRTKNPNKDLEDALSHFVQIQSIIGRPVGQEIANSQWIPPVQTQQVPNSPSSTQQMESVPVEPIKETSPSSIQPKEDKKIEVSQSFVEEKTESQEEAVEVEQTLVAEETSEIAETSIIESEKKEEILEQDESINTLETVDKPEIMDNVETTQTPSNDDQEEKRSRGAIKKARQSYLKSRTLQ